MSILSYDEETIVAQCTPQGSGALALIRLSGENALAIADRISLLASGKKVSELPTHTIHFGWVVNDKQEKIDQVLFLLTHGPRTFTGQDTVEITGHNNQFLCAAIIQAALKAGARHAKEGEFSKRAVLNKKMDVLQAEAINELIQANTPIALKQSLAQLEGSLSSWVLQLEEKLMQALALAEASFEFLEDEMHFAPAIEKIMHTILADIAQIEKTFDQQQHIRQGIRIALLGAVNAGKSSLFNALIQKERAIVTDIPGTTRDTIEAGLYKKGFYWTVIDTAGLRETDDFIEKAGIERSLQEAQKADVILLVVDSSQALVPDQYTAYKKILTTHAHKTILICTKSDCGAESNNMFTEYAPIFCSSHTRAGIDAVERAIEQKIDALYQELHVPFLLNQRQFDLLKAIAIKVHQLMPLLSEPVAYELVSIHVKDMLHVISDLSGRSLNEKMLDTVFSTFCIGK